MKPISLLLLLFSSNCLAETFYYGSHYITVDLRSDQSSLLKFEKPPLSSSCQPGTLQFEPLDVEVLSVGEQEQVRNSGLPENNDTDQTTKQLVRVTPQATSGMITCSFTLIGGAEVPIRFNLKDNIARPFLDFRPITSKYEGPKTSSQLSTLSSLVKGESIHLFDETKDHDVCDLTTNEHPQCHHYTHTTAIATYELTYAGTDSLNKVWSISIRFKQDTNFLKIADLDVPPGSPIMYSVITPQNDSYKKNDVAKLHILTSKQASKTEVMESLP